MSRHRTLVRFMGLQSSTEARAVVPGWNPHELIFIGLDKLPEEIRKNVLASDQYRCRATVNLAAVDPRELEFEDWEA